MRNLTRQLIARRPGRHTHLRPGRRPAVLGEGVTVRVGADTWAQVTKHYFGDGRSHGGALLCGTVHTSRGLRLLVRSFVPAVDDRDYGPGRYGHHALRAHFVRQVVKTARAQNLVPLFVHAHGGSGSVAFSTVDLESHQRGYPALCDINANSVGALVLAHGAAAGELFQPDRSRHVIDKVVVVGTSSTVLRPGPDTTATGTRAEHDRQARMLGASGQAMLARMRVVVVGAGGAGMLAVEYLSRLGIGQVVVIDADTVEVSNLSRLPGTRRRDAHPHLCASRWPVLARVGQRLATPKVTAATRLIRQAGMGTDAVAVHARVQHPLAASQLSDADFIVLAADSAYARYLVNIAAHQYLVPAIQVGVKVPVAPDGSVGRLFAVTRTVLPHAGCLRCAGVIDPAKLAVETLPEHQRALADYGTGEPAPSVITFNAVAVSHALSAMLLNLTGLAGEQQSSTQRFLLRSGEARAGRSTRDGNCPVCGVDGVRGLGDTLPLPTSTTG